MFDAEAYISYLGIATQQQTSGWTNTYCPFCYPSGEKFYGGWRLSDGKFRCWKCGRHRVSDVIMAMERLDVFQAQKVMKRFTLSGLDSGKLPQRTIRKAGASKLIYPTGTAIMQANHRTYLQGRNFDDKILETTWGLLGTGPTGAYRFRVIIPVMDANNQPVSYQGRDITGQREPRYMACKIEQEVVRHKHTLYGLQHMCENVTVLVEGVADAWRIGPGALATFGTGWTPQQGFLICTLPIKRVVMLFDSEDRAQESAERLGQLIAQAGKEVVIIKLDGDDPGNMADDDAKAFRQEVGLT